MKRLVVLISNKGEGTNLQAIIDGVKSGKISGQIVTVISDTEDALGLKRARKHKLPIKIIPKKEDLLKTLKKLNPDYICLAGWKQIILDEVIDAFPNRILNTHPGLIPDTLDGKVKNPDGTEAIWNKGKMTDKAMQNFLDNNATYAGCTNHFLSHEFDFGPVLGRCFEKLRKGDTVESLYARLKKKENQLYIDVLAKLCNAFNVLIIGQNGREHALAETYAKSKNVNKVIMTPGNGLTDFKNPKIKNYPDVGMMDFKKIVDVCKKENIDIVDVPQENIIEAGYVGKLEKLGIKVFGPTKEAARLEWDKEWARKFMLKHSMRIPFFKSFTSTKEAIKYVNNKPDELLFIKATGLAYGKGVIRAENKKEAIEAINKMQEFGESSATFLIEEGLQGEEFSLFAVCDGGNFKIIGWAQDHKRVNDNDQGPNTGGMGSVAPASVVTEAIIQAAKTKILEPLMRGMKAEGNLYRGIIYLGGMIVSGEIRVIEFNCRWGDPEAEVILPSIKSDYLKIVQGVLSKKLKEIQIDLDKKVRVSVAGCSRGYPDDYSKVKGKEIFGLNDAMKIPGVLIFGSGIKRNGNRFYANGGRVFYIVGEGADVIEARQKAYSAMKLISIEGDNLHYRNDIGWRDLARLRKDASVGKKG